MRLGIDIGGTKIEAAILDGSGAIAARRRVPAPRTYDQSVAVTARLVSDLEHELATRVSVGVCAPGSRSPRTGLIRNAQNTPLDGRAFHRDLGAELGREVRLANDAHCFALSEATDGAAAGASLVFGVIVGTGVGGGLVHAGQLLPSHNGIAGEWAHVPLPWASVDEFPGPPCTCGKTGCIETFLAGPGLARDHQHTTGESLRAEDIAARAAHDPAALATLVRYADRMARALAQVINLLDPDVIVLGGGLSALRPLYELVPSRWPRYVLTNEPLTTRLVPARHGDASGVRGAACLWPGDGPQ